MPENLHQALGLARAIRIQNEIDRANGPEKKPIRSWNEDAE